MGEKIRVYDHKIKKDDILEMWIGAPERTRSLLVRWTTKRVGDVCEASFVSSGRTRKTSLIS